MTCLKRLRFDIECAACIHYLILASRIIQESSVGSGRGRGRGRKREKWVGAKRGLSVGGRRC